MGYCGNAPILGLLARRLFWRCGHTPADIHGLILSKENHFFNSFPEGYPDQA
jgi:hypothetical protein